MTPLCCTGFVRSMLASGTLFAALTAWSAQSQASLIHDIFECDFDGTTCTTFLGTIEFPSDSGDQTDGTGITLNYTGGSSDIFAGGATFDQNDIQEVSWTIDPSTWLLTVLDMRLDTNPLCLSGTIGECTYVAVDLLSPPQFGPGPVQVAGSGGSCDDQDPPDCISGISMANPNQVVPRHGVPEPATLALIIIGLAATGCTTRKNKST